MSINLPHQSLSGINRFPNLTKTLNIPYRYEKYYARPKTIREQEKASKDKRGKGEMDAKERNEESLGGRGWREGASAQSSAGRESKCEGVSPHGISYA